ncbi:MAG TPA: DUF5329 family protein [Candidatus Didemnitutus sp.]|nr:DUF5329 family protein [Candidatus Didemnitutus sp.]
MRHVLRLLVLAGLCALLAPCLRAAPASAEDQKIEALLAYVGEHKDAVFIRNGSEYSAGTAVKFLRGKWDRARDEVKTARDFIDKVATKSSTTGKPYQIRLADGTMVSCADFLAGRLAELENVH